MNSTPVKISPRSITIHPVERKHAGATGENPSYRAPIRLLRLAQVLNVTGLGKTPIYELQAEGDFPMRVKITSHSVGWVEEDVQAWLARRVALRNRSSNSPSYP
jgi:prophage regulatory protein